VSVVAKGNGAIPSGSADMLFETCATLGRIEQNLKSVYAQRGFREVATSFFEYYDTFLAAGTLTQDRMCVLIDQEGFINVLRPDLTTPIARLACKRLAEAPLPLRLCYSQSVFRREPGGGRNLAIPQSGIELLGASGLKADTDVLLTAITALESLGRVNFKLELGHVGIFKTLASKIPFKADDFERIRQSIQNKNYAALGDTLDLYKKDFPDECAAINRLPRLFGGLDVFSEARAIIKDPGALSLLDTLELLLKKLESIRPQTVIVDLGLVQHIDYYSGLVFKGYLENTGEAALSGGRYDGLTKSFGRELAAIGFGINLDVALSAIERAQGAAQLPAPAAMIHYDNGFGKAAYDLMDALAQKSICCEMGLFDKLSENVGLAQSRGIKKMYVVSDTVEEREI
jgi:ATP phosphoribosyltransferase regulatory subunit